MSPSVWPDASSVLTSKIPRLFVLKARTNSAQVTHFWHSLRHLPDHLPCCKPHCCWVGLGVLTVRFMAVPTAVIFQLQLLQARELESYLRFRAAQASAQQSQAEAQPSSKSKRNVSKEKNTSGSKRAAFPDSAYPTKDSTSGGWAGGEVGLRKFLEVSIRSGSRPCRETYIRTRGFMEFTKASLRVGIPCSQLP